MFNSRVENMWNNNGNWWLKFDDSFSQGLDLLKIILRKLWKSLVFSQNFHYSVQTKTTACISFFISYIKSLIHNFHIAYYDDYDIFNKKGAQ